MSGPVLRPATRAVVLDPDDRILLDASDDGFAPRALPRLVRALLEEGAPAEPLDVGV
jgi:hypothetical protein